MSKALDPFGLRVPCTNCPFRSQPPPQHTGPGDGLFHGLHPERVQGIAQSLDSGQTFPCHKTVDYTEDEDGEPYEDTDDSQACAGALATMAREDNLMANFHLRLRAMASGKGEQFVHEFVASLDLDDAPVYDSLEEWVEELTIRYEDDGGEW